MHRDELHGGAMCIKSDDAMQWGYIADWDLQGSIQTDRWYYCSDGGPDVAAAVDVFWDDDDDDD